MVKGIEALHQRFAAVPESVKRAVLAVTESGAQRIAAQTRLLAPKDQGELAGSVRVDPYTKAFKGKQAFGFRITYGNLTTKVALRGGAAFINNAILQEFGTLEMPAHPALLPAFRANKKSIRAAQTRAFRRAMAKA